MSAVGEVCNDREGARYGCGILGMGREDAGRQFMNVSKFLRTVRDMRDAQKKYFKSRLRSDLIASKELEKQVDQALADGIVFDLDIEVLRNEEPEQGELFEGDEL